MLKKIRLTCPNCGRRVADYRGNTEAMTVLAEEGETERDTLQVKCHLCKSQVLILMEDHEAYEMNKR